MPRFRQEITDWDAPNHIYITQGTELLGYVPRNSNQVQWFKTPKRTWSPSRRKFRDLTKREISELVGA